MNNIFSKEDLYIKSMDGVNYTLSKIYKSIINEQIPDFIIKVYNIDDINVGWLISPYHFIKKYDYKCISTCNLKFFIKNNKICLEKVDNEFHEKIYPIIYLHNLKNHNIDYINKMIDYQLGKAGYDNNPLHIVLKYYDNEEYENNEYYYNTSEKCWILQNLNDRKPLIKIIINII